MSEPYIPELGQVVFGAPWGEVAMHDPESALLEAILADLGLDPRQTTQEAGT